MKFQIISDLHCECEPAPVPAAAEVIVAAGDIGAKKWALRAIDAWLADGAQVLMVLGNHEYWGKEMIWTLRRWRAWAEERPGLTLLDRDSIVIDGVRFLGATLWTDFDGADRFAMATEGQEMNDYRKIRFSGRKLRPQDTLAMHYMDRRWLEGELAAAHDGPTVVVTHHAPHPGSGVGPAYVSNLEEVILAGAPEIWIHGHIHEAVDYRVGETRVIANPHGYPGQETGFQPDFLVEMHATPSAPAPA